MASKRGHTEIVQLLLAQLYIDINCQSIWIQNPPFIQLNYDCFILFWFIKIDQIQYQYLIKLRWYTLHPMVFSKSSNFYYHRIALTLTAKTFEAKIDFFNIYFYLFRWFQLSILYGISKLLNNSSKSYWCCEIGWASTNCWPFISFQSKLILGFFTIINKIVVLIMFFNISGCATNRNIFHFHFCIKMFIVNHMYLDALVRALGIYSKNLFCFLSKISRIHVLCVSS